MNKIVKLVLLFTLVCFVLPFVTISCENQEIDTLNGVQLVTGVDTEDIQLDPNPIMAILAVSTVVGVLLAFLLKPLNYKVLGIISAVNIILLFIFKSTFTNGVAKESDGMGIVEYKAGFWLMFVSLLLSVLINGYFYYIEMNMNKKKNEYNAERA